jgi:hypothetical protein
LDNGNAVIEQAKLVVGNGEVGDGFGWSVAIYENLILVGSTEVDDGVGLAYLYVDNSTNRNGCEWIQLFQWKPNNKTTLHAYGDAFGWSVALDRNTAVIGTDEGDAAFVYQKRNENDEFSWTFMAKLIGPSDSKFGLSIDVVGALDTDDSENGQEQIGAAFVFLVLSEQARCKWPN